MAAFIILLISFVISENYIKGTVFNQENTPISEVNIQVLDSEFVTSSDKNGIFIINAENKNLSIKVSHIKYQDQILDIMPGTDNLSIFLIEKPIDLGQMIVTGLRTQSYIKNTPVLTHVITSDDIKKSAYSSVKEALEMSLPNVQNVMSSHAGISNEEVKIQGLDNKYLLFLVDGKRISAEFAGNLDFRMLDLSNIDRIEIVEGGMSSLYGSSAIGGVVNIITKNNNKKFNLNYSYLHDDPMINVHSFFSGFNYNNFFYNINIVNQNTDGYDLTPNPDQIFPLKTLEEYNTLSFGHNLGYDNKQNFSIEVNYKNYKNDIFLYQNQTLQILDQDNPNYPTYNYISYRDWMPQFENNNYGLNLKYYKNNSLFNVVYNLEEYIKSYYYYNYTDQPCDQIDCSNSSNLLEQEFINGISKNNSFLIQYNKEKKQNLFTLGIEHNNDSYSSYNIYHYGYEDSEGYFDSGDLYDNNQCDQFGPIRDCLYESFFNSQDGTKHYKKTSYFIGNQWSLLEDKIGASFRYVDSKIFDDNYVYSLSYMIKRYQPYDIRLNYSKGFRTPSIKELFYDWYGHSPAIVGNQNLLPTTNDYFSTSIQKFKQNHDFSFELFYNNVKDMIGGIYVDVNDDDVDEYQYTNFNNILFYGINTHFNLKIKYNTFKLVYNFTNPESDSNSALQLISKHSFRFNWLRNIIDNKIYLSFNLKYSGEKFVNLGSEKLILDDYILSDFLTIFNVNKNLEFKMGYKNIFDYKDSRRLLETGSDYLSTYDPGRRFIVEFKLTI